MKEEKKNKGSVLDAESAYKSQTAQFGLVMTNFFGRAKARRGFCSHHFKQKCLTAEVLNLLLGRANFLDSWPCRHETIVALLFSLSHLVICMGKIRDTY